MLNVLDYLEIRKAHAAGHDPQGVTEYVAAGIHPDGAPGVPEVDGGPSGDGASAKKADAQIDSPRLD